MPKPTKRWEDLNDDEDAEYYRSVNSCPNIQVKDTDSIEVVGTDLYIHEAGLASRIKGVVRLTPHQWQNLLWDYLELDEIKDLDLSSVDLSGFLEYRK